MKIENMKLMKRKIFIVETGATLWLVLVITFIASFFLTTTIASLVQHKHMLYLRDQQLQAYQLVQNGVVFLLDLIIEHQPIEEDPDDNDENDNDKNDVDHENDYDENNNRGNEETEEGEGVEEVEIDPYYSLHYETGYVEIDISQITPSQLEAMITGTTEKGGRQAYWIKIERRSLWVTQFEKIK